MTTNEIGFVVDKLAQQVGIATEKVAPIAQEIIRQYVFSHAVMSCVFGLVFIVSVLFACVIDKTRDDEPYWGIAWIVAAIFSIVPCLVNLFRALAPLPCMLKL
jgi:heme/copper-type cytochrome/quinol oxidase subunit 2